MSTRTEKSPPPCLPRYHHPPAHGERPFARCLPGTAGSARHDHVPGPPPEGPPRGRCTGGPGGGKEGGHSADALASFRNALGGWPRASEGRLRPRGRPDAPSRGKYGASRGRVAAGEGRSALAGARRALARGPVPPWGGRVRPRGRALRPHGRPDVPSRGPVAPSRGPVPPWGGRVPPSSRGAFAPRGGQMCPRGGRMRPRRGGMRPRGGATRRSGIWTRSAEPQTGPRTIASQPLQVLPLRMGDGDRVVRRGGEGLEEGDAHSGFDGGGEEDLAEELGVHGAAATEGEQEAPGLDAAAGPGGSGPCRRGPRRRRPGACAPAAADRRSPGRSCSVRSRRSSKTLAFTQSTRSAAKPFEVDVVAPALDAGAPTDSTQTTRAAPPRRA